jgi:hypothetical protein
VTERTDHDRYMDMLATEIGEVLDGVPLQDVISACAAIIGFTLAEMTDDQARREAVLQTTIAFIRKVCAEKVMDGHRL